MIGSVRDMIWLC